MARRQGLAPTDFESLYDRVAQPLLVWLTRRTFDAQVALDLWAETWAAAYASRRRFRGTTDAEASAWVYAIAWRQYATYVRRGSAERRALERLGLERPPAEDADIARLERLAGLSELRGAVAAGLAALSAEQREAIELRVVRELSYPDIAERLRVPEPTVRARVSRGLRALGESIDPTLDLKTGGT
jgi:RNA polymerase sigma factor (sigma-70 family)